VLKDSTTSRNAVTPLLAEEHETLFYGSMAEIMDFSLMNLLEVPKTILGQSCM
jgi:hypothetical protein